MIRKMKSAGPAIAALVMLAGCHTIAGIGKDLQAGGDAISQASRDVRSELAGDTPVARASND
jgi:entericidin B